MTDECKNGTKRGAVDRRSFLKSGVSVATFAGAVPASQLFMPSIARAALKVEKEDLKFGFIKLTDMAPIAIAKELGYFEDEGLWPVSRSVRRSASAPRLTSSPRSPWTSTATPLRFRMPFGRR
jgi:hypothetical protein